jgi:KTSC domain
MFRTRITSKLIYSWAYDWKTQTLEIEFLKTNKQDERRIYHYFDVPMEKIEMFQKADSPGGYFLVFIKPNHHSKLMEVVRAETKPKEEVASVEEIVEWQEKINAEREAEDREE